MNRRKYLEGVGSASLAALAGCTNSMNQTGTREVEWEYTWEGFVGSGYQPAVIVTGEVENIGDVYVEEIDLDCQILAEDGSMIDSRNRTLRYIETNEEQLFYWKFRPDESEAEQVDEVEIEGTYPE